MPRNFASLYPYPPTLKTFDDVEKYLKTLVASLLENDQISDSLIDKSIRAEPSAVVDADFANTPNSGDSDTDDLIDKIRDALIEQGLIASS